jgi:hypothetical protein
MQEIGLQMFRTDGSEAGVVGHECDGAAKSPYRDNLPWIGEILTSNPLAPSKTPPHTHLARYVIPFGADLFILLAGGLAQVAALSLHSGRTPAPLDTFIVTVLVFGSVRLSKLDHPVARSVVKIMAAVGYLAFVVGAAGFLIWWGLRGGG